MGHPLRFPAWELVRYCLRCNWLVVAATSSKQTKKSEFLLYPPLNVQWNELCSFVADLNLSTEPDHIVLSLGSKQTCTTKSVYEHLEKNIAGCDFNGFGEPKSL